MSVDELAERAPRLFDYLEPLIERLAGRSAYDLALDEEHPFGIQGAFQHLSGSEAYVASRYIAPGGSPPTAPVFPETYSALGRSTVPYFNNKSNFLQVQSEEEAWFIATFFSSPVVQDLLARISMSTTISPRKLASVPIPRFDLANDAHLELVELGRRSVEPEEWAANVEQIQALVIASAL